MAVEELAAIQRVRDFFAVEAVLALDRYERDHANEPTQARDAARRLKHWWTRLRMAEVDFGRFPTDAERILIAAQEIATHNGDESELRMRDAVGRAAAKWSSPVTGIGEFRRNFEAAYAGGVREPDSAKWVQKSLRRLANASLLGEVLTTPAKVTLSRSVRAAAREVVQQSQKLTSRKERLQKAQAVPIPSWGETMRGQIALDSGYVVYGALVRQAHLPTPVQLLVDAPAAVYVAYQTLRLWAERRGAINELNSAQAALSTVRTDLAGSLDQANPLERSDNAAIRKARSKGRGRGK